LRPLHPALPILIHAGLWGSSASPVYARVLLHCSIFMIIWLPCWCYSTYVVETMSWSNLSINNHTKGFASKRSKRVCEKQHSDFKLWDISLDFEIVSYKGPIQTATSESCHSLWKESPIAYWQAVPEYMAFRYCSSIFRKLFQNSTHRNG
jgi:hypothetical protein